MKPLRGAVGMLALAVLGLSANPGRAAWNNVFQVCCHGCQQPAVSNYADPCCAPPPPVCTTRMVQRCYYQPVTTYKTSYYLEPVTTYRTSYYYQPVTSYRYSMYYDASTCSYQQVACPQTCLQLRSQCCPVQSWVQRCCTVPVTSVQQMFYYEPVTTCCAAPAAPACPPAYGTGVPAVGEQRSAAPAVPAVPGVGEQRLPPGPAVPGDGTSYRQPLPRQTPVPNAPPQMRIDRIVSNAGIGVEGQVVSSNQLPHSGAKLLFVSAEKQGVQFKANADAAGRFQLALADGSWLVYVEDHEGRSVFHKKIDVGGARAIPVLLVSR
jgi:hypothetical protein